MAVPAKERMAAMRARRKEAVLCIECGSPAQGKTRCKGCREGLAFSAWERYQETIAERASDEDKRRAAQMEKLDAFDRAQAYASGESEDY